MPSSPPSVSLIRKKRRRQLTALSLLLLVGGVLILVLPSPIPLIARLGVAFVDLFAAAFLWLARHQHFRE